jgi:hypothetical protein
MSRCCFVALRRGRLLLALLGGSLPAQLRGPSTVAAGGSITIDVGSSGHAVAVTAPAQGTTRHRVPPDKRVVIPVPNVPVGSVILVTVGDGPLQQGLWIEVVAP